MSFAADDLRREAAPEVEGSRALSIQSGHLQSEGSKICKLHSIVRWNVQNAVLPSVGLSDLAPRAHCR